MLCVLPLWKTGRRSLFEDFAHPTLRSTTNETSQGKAQWHTQGEALDVISGITLISVCRSRCREAELRPTRCTGGDRPCITRKVAAALIAFGPGCGRSRIAPGSPGGACSSRTTCGRFGTGVTLGAAAHTDHESTSGRTQQHPVSGRRPAAVLPPKWLNPAALLPGARSMAMPKRRRRDGRGEWTPFS